MPKKRKKNHQKKESKESSRVAVEMFPNDRLHLPSFEQDYVETDSAGIEFQFSLIRKFKNVQFNYIGCYLKLLSTMEVFVIIY